MRVDLFLCTIEMALLTRPLDDSMIEPVQVSKSEGYTTSPNPNINGPAYRGPPNSRQSVHLDERDAFGPMHLPCSPSTVVTMLERKHSIVHFLFK